MEILPLKKFKDFIEGHSPAAYSLVLAIPISLLILGFLIWNIYLYTFGFVESELLRARFIVSGLSFSIITFLIISIMISIGSVLLRIYEDLIGILNKFLGFRFNVHKGPWLLEVRIPVTFVLGIVWLFFYIIYIFPSLPQVIGGGQPRLAALIVNVETVEVLSTFGIGLGEGAVYQTEGLCIVHENKEGVFILQSDRVFMLNKELFKGFVILPGVRSIYEQQCISFASDWSAKGAYFAVVLLRVQIQNLFNDLLGLPHVLLGLKTIPVE